MNWIDRAISHVSPGAALKRVRARKSLAVVESLSYDGAKSGRRTDGWFRPGTSANVETAQGLAKLRDGARDLVRNNPLAAKALTELRTKAVGTGIVPQARTQNDAVNKRLDELFAAWSAECNSDGQPGFAGMQALAASCIVESGECLLRFRTRLPKDGLTIPLQLQMLEPDFLDHTRSEVTDTGYVIQGVEYDKIGREIAYWIYPAHPGELINTAWFRSAGVVPQRIPASNPNNPLDGIVRGFRKDRAGQVRGVSWFAPVMTALYDLDGYDDAERVRKRIEACLSAFITSEEVDGNTPALGSQSTDSNGATNEEFRPGMIVRLRNGEAVTVAEPKSSGGYGDYVRVQQRVIAAGLGMPYEVLTGDLSQINYSSYRGGLLGFRDIIEAFRWNVLVPFICDPVWRRFVDACRIGGLVPTETTYDVDWSPPAFDLLDRKIEAEADQAMLRIGTMTWPQAVGRQGYDPTKQLDQISEYNQKFDEAGVILDCDPRRVARTGVSQQAPAADQQPPAA